MKTSQQWELTQLQVGGSQVQQQQQGWQLHAYMPTILQLLCLSEFSGGQYFYLSKCQWQCLHLAGNMTYYPSSKRRVIMWVIMWVLCFVRQLETNLTSKQVSTLLVTGSRTKRAKHRDEPRCGVQCVKLSLSTLLIVCLDS